MSDISYRILVFFLRKSYDLSKKPGILFIVSIIKIVDTGKFQFFKSSIYLHKYSSYSKLSDFLQPPGNLFKSIINY